MCPVIDVHELRDRSQEEHPETGALETSLKKNNIVPLSVYLGKKTTLVNNKTFRAIESCPEKITILHTERDTILVNTEDDAKKPWYFVRI